MNPNLEAYFINQAAPVSRYEGQLGPEFQVALSQHYGHAVESECAFSHTMTLPGGRVVRGAWDLRGSEDAVLGDHPIHGKRVLEYGPANGWLSAHLAPQASELVVIEQPLGVEQSVVPAVGALPPEAVETVRAMMERVRKGWWFTKREMGFSASAVYADPHAPPADLGRFDVSVLTTVLLRLPHPYLALQHAAAITDEAIIVTEPVTNAIRPDDQVSPVALFAPALPPDEVDHWWHHSPIAISRMLITLGFPKLALTVHALPLVTPTLQLFTIVARR